jgi:hypothetical protein
MKQALLVACFIVVSCVAYYSILKMEAMYSSEMLVDFGRTTSTRRYVLNDRIIHSRRCENLKSNTS